MKGVFQVVIEVDYTELLEKGDMETLKLFTGANDEQGVINTHMANISNEIDRILKDRPMIEYGLKGEVISDDDKKVQPQPQPQPQTEEEQEDYPAMDYPVIPPVDVEDEIVDAEIVEDELDDGVGVDEPVEVEENLDAISINSPYKPNTSTTEAYMNSLNEDLEKVATERGIIQGITVNAEMYDKMEIHFSVPKEKKIKNYLGHPVVVEDMQELYAISYKEYDTDKVTYFSRDEVKRY